ncbi:hypothetical protein C1280_11630 [Gemmata obscuriglobus]|uniref:Uncharacterized protein n=2 Tax=Gemmata obscuriglobus TaxID=114 RepID=A0A2Z3H836_9BACT|nr:hypothetical protein C1280_11630 [Gemmata obscuriglobus]
MMAVQVSFMFGTRGPRMSNGRLKMLAHLPASSDFSLAAAVAYFDGRQCGRRSVQAELAPEARSPTGFRVRFTSWAVVAWLEEGAEVLADSAELAAGPDLPAPPEVVAGCSRRLSVWSDPGLTADRRAKFWWLAAQLRERFAALHYDHFAVRWLTDAEPGAAPDTAV